MKKNDLDLKNSQAGPRAKKRREDKCNEVRRELKIHGMLREYIIRR